MIISYSEIFKFDTCKRAFYYSYVKNLRPIVLSDPMDTGTKGHSLLQTFYTCLQEGMNKTEAIKSVTDAASKVLVQNGLTDMNMVKAWTLVDNYIRDNEFEAEAVLVENRFLFPFSLLCDDPKYAHIEIGFTPDVVFKRTGGFYDVEDAKFIGRAWSGKKLDHYTQAKLYQVFLRRMGYPVTRSIVRFFNTTTAKITYSGDTLEKAEEAILIEEFIDTIKEVADHKSLPLTVLEKSRRTANYTICQGCFFSYPCALEAKGKSATGTFANDFVKSDYDYTR
jgi:hypothetical protein